MNDFTPKQDGILTGRRLEFFHADSLPEWGYAEPQTDTFAVLHPSEDIKEDKYPLYVVFHSAGHDVYSALACTWQKGNHDIYHAPKNMYALYLDCRQHQGDWWWGGNTAQSIIDEKRAGVELQPVEKRVMATIEWVMEKYPIDCERVYAVGNSMGGSGALGIAMNRGDVFAAVKVNVPAGVRHMADRCALDTVVPEGFKIPDPPPLVDYSAQNDAWSTGHEVLYRGMREKKYALTGFWGCFGHANNNDVMYGVNDLIHSIDIFNIKKSDPYVVYTNASCDDMIPWGDDGSILHENAGQVNAFFRNTEFKESENTVSVGLRLLCEDEWQSRVEFPRSAAADVSMRRLQKCRFAPGQAVAWEYDGKSGTVNADADGLVTVCGITITRETAVLTLRE